MSLSADESANYIGKLRNARVPLADRFDKVQNAQGTSEPADFRALQKAAAAFAPEKEVEHSVIHANPDIKHLKGALTSEECN